MYMKKTPEQRLLFLDNLKFESFKKSVIDQVSYWLVLLMSFPDSLSSWRVQIYHYQPKH